MALTHTTTSSPVVSLLLKSTLDYPLLLRFPFWTLYDVFVKHRHFIQWWCERYFMFFKSLIRSINTFPCQARWLCYSPNTGMLNIWLLYVLVTVSPFLCQGSMPKNKNWKYGVVMHILLSQLLLHFCCWVWEIKVFQVTLLKAVGIFQEISAAKKPEQFNFLIWGLWKIWDKPNSFARTSSLFCPPHLPLSQRKLKGINLWSENLTWEGNFWKRKLKSLSFSRILEGSWTRTIRLMQMEMPRSSVEYSLVPHKRTQMFSSTLLWKCTIQPSPHELRV